MALTRFSAASAYAIITLPQTTGSCFVFKCLSKQALKKVGITFFKEIRQHFTSAVPPLPCTALDSKLQ